MCTLHLSCATLRLAFGALRQLAGHLGEFRLAVRGLSCYNAPTMSLDPTTTATLDSLREKIAEDPYALEKDLERKLREREARDASKKDLKALKSRAVEVLETILEGGGGSIDTQRKAAVDILNFSEKAKNDVPVTEEQLGWLGKVLIETEEIRISLEIGKG